MSCRLLFSLPLLALLALAGCDKPQAADPAAPGSPAPAGPYYDGRQQLDSLVRALDARHAPVEKQVSLRGGQPETKRVDGVKWADELQMFYQADINKAALRGAYEVKKTAGEVAGGTEYTYRRKPGYPNAPVIALDVLCSPGHQLRLLHATIEQHNALFTSKKELVLTGGNEASLQNVSYQVKGQQKLILFDALSFTTEARSL